MLTNLIDFLIRNQSSLFLSIGALGSVILFRFVFSRTFYWRVLELVAFDLPPLGRGDFRLGITNFEIRPASRLPGLIGILWRLFSVVPKRILVPLVFVAGMCATPLILGIYFTFARYEIVDRTWALERPSPIRPSKPGAKIAIVLLHGWTGDATSTWGNFTKFLDQDKRLSETVDIWAAAYPTYFTRRNLTVGQLANWLFHDFVSKSLLGRYKKIYFIGHSLGGVLAREIYLQSYLSEEDGIRGWQSIRMIVSLGSPYAGASLPLLAKALGLQASYLEDIGKSSSYLKNLSLHWEILARRPISFCVWSPMDGVVDQVSATYQCEHSEGYPQWTHIELEKPLSPEDVRYRVPVDAILQDSELKN